MEQPTNGQRALFTFLGYSLVGSFLAGFVVLAALILAKPLRLDGFLPAELPNPGAAAIGTFIWSAIPASLTGVALAALAWSRESFPWLAAAVAGGVAFTIAAVVMPPPSGLPLTVLAVVAAFVAIAVRGMLIGAGIIK